MTIEPDPSSRLASSLHELALDLRWTWSHEADALWAQIQPELWEQFHNPWTLLRSIAPERLAALAADGDFTRRLDGLVATREAYQARPTWYDTTRPGAAPGGVAYFSLEFGLGSALPLYAGGLGVLAGDFLKTASDLGAPVVGVGLLYQQGYFRQALDEAGEQRELHAFNDPADMPIEPAVVGGAPLRIGVSLPGRELQLRVWRARVGRATLYLLDGNDPLNTPSDRAITAALYEDDKEVRLLQELALGVGGWRVLEAAGHAVDICHINEGHAAFAAVERAAALAERAGMSFDEALCATRPGNVFTTHTPVAAGFDRFDPGLLARHLGAFGRGGWRDPAAERRLLGLGRVDPDDASEPFNMAFAAMRMSGACFAVSRVHAEVSRRVFQPLFPRWPEEEVPIGHVTNGVHTPSWDSAEADQLWTTACGKERWRRDGESDQSGVEAASDEDVWSMRGRSRADLVAHVRRRLAMQLVARGRTVDAAAVAATVFDPNVLTLGFARRFTDYKRPNLLLRDPERLAGLLLDPQRPVQIVVAGKAHPDDLQGKAMIREWIALADQPRLRRRIVFLEDYDLGLAQELVQGVDVWLNTPRRPFEACGTSGMKVLVNGGLNCSVLDGWWAEAYAPDLGWAVGGEAPQEGGDVDAADADALYRLIETAIAPKFYDRAPDGVPRAWVARIRRSMRTLTARFSSARMLREYLDAAYAPGAAALRARAADGWAPAKAIARWSERVRRAWPGLHLGVPTTSPGEGGWRLSIPVLLGELSPDDVSLELYAEPRGQDPHVLPLAPGASIPGSVNGFVFAGSGPASRSPDDFTVRATPRRAGVCTPVELPLIAWQR